MSAPEGFVQPEWFDCIVEPAEFPARCMGCNKKLKDGDECKVKVIQWKHDNTQRMAVFCTPCTEPEFPSEHDSGAVATGIE